jgi:FkbM family methyltransferase
MRSPARIGGFWFVCDLRDSISREVCFAGGYEPQETVLVGEILQPGMTFVDVGANWGYFTLLGASRVGPAGRVVALEPDPRMYRLLTENVERNRWDHVTCLPVAASGQAGTVRLSGFLESDGNFGLSRVVASDPDAHVMEAEAKSLDAILDNLEIASVDLLKMDIEGAEGFAVAGLAHALEAHRVKRILLELHPSYLGEHDMTVESVLTPLIKAGYGGMIIDHSPQATRDAAYGRTRRSARLLRPYSPDQHLDEWPHLLWVAPQIVD